jgi:hypothetical protein
MPPTEISPPTKLEQDMLAEMRELLGPGYVRSYYEQAARGFIDIAVRQRRSYRVPNPSVLAIIGKIETLISELKEKL